MLQKVRGFRSNQAFHWRYTGNSRPSIRIIVSQPPPTAELPRYWLFGFAGAEARVVHAHSIVYGAFAMEHELPTYPSYLTTRKRPSTSHTLLGGWTRIRNVGRKRRRNVAP